ncbi:MAG: mannitol dehydrogenase family protein [Microbacteriaceae bacterium]
MSRPRLSYATLPARFGPHVDGPAIDPLTLSIGIVHFGIGAFHRSHQAVFTEDAAAVSGDRRWGILGVTGRSETVVRQLRPQDCLYGVLQKGVLPVGSARAGEAAADLRVIGSIREAVWPGRDSGRVVAAMAHPTTHIASLTITEKGYLRGSDGAIDLALPEVGLDLALIERELIRDPADVAGAATKIGEEAASHTAIGLLVRGLARRYRRGGPPLTVLACDNVVNNGAMVKRVVLSLAAAVQVEEPVRAGWLGWLEESVSYPSSMVDRITPAATDHDHAEAFALLGLEDEALVVAEPFSQWVIEDDFAGPRPAWERAGAILTADVTPFERAKLRILNATHSLLAYIGVLAGYATIADAVADDQLRAIARRILDDDILPTLQAPEGLDLARYRDEVLSRFANPALAHTTIQIAMDGSQKLPNRVLGTASDRIAAGYVPAGLAFVIAAWIRFIAAGLEPGGPSLDDPMAAQLRAAVGSPAAIESDPAGVVERVFALREVFSPRLRESGDFRAAVVAQLAEVGSVTAEIRKSNG